MKLYPSITQYKFTLSAYLLGFYKNNNIPYIETSIEIIFEYDGDFCEVGASVFGY